MKDHRFEEIIKKFSSARIAVLGDFFLDFYIHLDRSLSELSLETHKEAFQAVNLRGQPGTAGVVTNNLTALGAQSSAIAYIGKDGSGYILKRALEERKVNTDFLIETEERFTPTYTKPLMQEVDGQIIELNRIDIINRSPNSQALNNALVKSVFQAVEAYDGILVAEQVKLDGYGTMSPPLRNALAEVSKKYPGKIIMVDSRHFAAKYRNVSLKLNLSEAAASIRDSRPDLRSISSDKATTAARSYASALWEILKKPIFITLGDQGIAGMADDTFFHYPGYQIDGPVDIVGAGDSVLAGIGLAMCVGASPQEAAYIGNLVGSITVQQIGTTGIASRADLRARHKQYQQQNRR